MTATAPKPVTPARRRGRPAVGRTTPLALDDIVECALHIVDDEGRDAVTMRRLATELGVTPMAIYHHIPDKPALMNALVDRVWGDIATGLPELETDPIERMVQLCVRTRHVWLEHFDLANLAVAVAAADEAFVELTRLLSVVFEAAGFPDCPLAYSAMQNFTLGSIQTNANRKAASLYFGRDPEATHSDAMRLLDENNASADHRRLVEARFDEGDERNFEPSLRALIHGLLAAPP